MSVRRRGKFWIVDVGDGSRRIRRSAGTLGEGRKLEAEIRQRLAQAKVPGRGLDAAFLRYLQHEVAGLKDAERQKGRAKHLIPYIRGRTFDDVPEIAEAIKADLLAQHYKPATINRRLALLRRVCSLAFRAWGWIDQPVAQKVRMLPERNERHVYLTHGQLEELVAECRAAEGAALKLLAYTGMRKGEFFGLLRGVGEIRGNTIILGTGTKSGRPRAIPVPKPARGILRMMPLPVTEQTVRMQFEAARTRLRMPDLRIHDLRHTYASWLAQKNVGLGTIGALLGHSQASTTRRYAHLSLGALEAAVGRLK